MCIRDSGEAILVSDPALLGSDTLGTARTLAAAINKIGDVQVALFGKQAIDGDTGHTPVPVSYTHLDVYKRQR